MGLLVFLRSRDGIPILRITAIAVVLTLLIAAVTYLRLARPDPARVAVVVVLASLAVVSIYVSRDHLIADSELNETASAVRAVVDDESVPSDATLEVDLRGPTILERWEAYQFYLPEFEIRPYDPSSQVGTPHRYVFSRSNNGRFLALGARRLWTDPQYPLALWELPG
jgi:hypothetical protein